MEKERKFTHPRAGRINAKRERKPAPFRRRADDYQYDYPPRLKKLREKSDKKLPDYEAEIEYAEKEFFSTVQKTREAFEKREIMAEEAWNGFKDAADTYRGYVDEVCRIWEEAEGTPPYDLIDIINEL